MPPSPRVKVELNEEVYAKACAALGLTDQPPVRFLNKLIRVGKDHALAGGFHPLTGQITVYTAFDSMGNDMLRAVVHDLTNTVLHELRHAAQTKNWPPERLERSARQGYFSSDEEADANAWANANVSTYRGLVRVKRTYPNGGFSRLGRHADRQTV